MDESEPTEPKVVNSTTNNHPFEVDWDQMFLIIGALSVCAVAIAITLSIASFNTNRNEKMAEAIKNGSHPMDVYCAFDSSSENKVCLIRAAVAGKEIK